MLPFLLTAHRDCLNYLLQVVCVRDFEGLLGLGLLLITACFRVMYGLIGYSVVISTPDRKIHSYISSFGDYIAANETRISGVVKVTRI